MHSPYALFQSKYQSKLYAKMIAAKSWFINETGNSRVIISGTLYSIIFQNLTRTKPYRQKHFSNETSWPFYINCCEIYYPTNNPVCLPRNNCCNAGNVLHLKSGYCASCGRLSIYWLLSKLNLCFIIFSKLLTNLFWEVHFSKFACLWHYDFFSLYDISAWYKIYN